MTTDAACDRLSTLVDRLAAEYSTPRVIVSSCVESAWEAVRYFGATGDSEMIDLAERIAERELRLRLGLEREVARLDPENHSGRRTAAAE
jgi:hypothetical protein